MNWAWSKSKLDLQAANKVELKMAKERDADLMAQMLSEPNPFPNLVPSSSSIRP